MVSFSLDWSVIVMFLLSFYLGWNIGANDAANCIGPAVGARILSVKRGVMLVALMVFLGALLQGSKTIKTMGNISGIKEIEIAVFAVLLGASLVLSFLTIKGIPVSTTFAVLGATIGVSLLLKAQVSWGIASAVFLCGLFTPVAALILSYLMQRVMAKVMGRPSILMAESKFKWLIIAGGLFMSYSLGANNVGNSMGLLVERGLAVPILAGFLGGLAIAAGAMTMGKNVILTVGKEISDLDYVSAFSASIGAGLCLYILALFGIPTSSSFAIVGAVAGVGIAHSTSVVNVKVLKKVARNWVLCPIASAVVAIMLFLIMKALGL